MEPLVVAEFRATRGAGGGPDKTILFGAAGHDSRRVRAVPFFLAQHGDSLPGVAELARRAGVEPIVLADHGPLDLSLVVRMRREITARNCRILHTHGFKSDVYGLWIARTVPGLKLVATAHGWSRPLDGKHRLYHRLDRWALRRFPKVLAVSEDTASRLERIGVRRDRLEVVPNGIDVSDWKPVEARPFPSGLPPGRRIVGAVGRLSVDKDIETLIEAFARIAARFQDVVLAVIGDGPHHGDLIRRARETEVADRILFLGYRPDVRDLYAAMDVVVQSSRTEGMPNTVLEAMAMERPVVATAVGGIPEVIRDGEDGLLFPAGEGGVLAARLATVLQDESLRRALGRRGRRRVVESFSFTARLRRLERIYEDMARPAVPS